MNSGLDIGHFKTLDTDPGGTLTKLTEYLEQMELLFQLIFRNQDGTTRDPTNNEKKALLKLKGGSDMRNLFIHVGKVVDTDSYDDAVKKINDALTKRTNGVVQRNMLFSNHPQGSKSFERWSQEISNAAKLINYDNYNWETAAVDAMMLQTSSPKLRERAILDNTTYEQLIKLGISKEQSVKGAAMLEEASGQSSTSNVEEEVRRLQMENQQLKSKDKDCGRCGRSDCPQGTKCFAYGEECSKCHKKNHFGRVCKSASSSGANSARRNNHRSNRSRRVRRVAESDSEDSDESLNRIISINKVNKSHTNAKLLMKVKKEDSQQCVDLVTDTRYISNTG